MAIVFSSTSRQMRQSVLAHLADHVLAVGLQLRDFRAQHVSLLAVLEDLAAPANVVLALDQDARELVARFLADEFQEREPVQDVWLDRLLEFRAGHRLLQHFCEDLAEGGVFGLAGAVLAFALPVLLVEQGNVNRLADQVEQVLARKLDELGAEENVIMDVVETDSQL